MPLKCQRKACGELKLQVTATKKTIGWVSFIFWGGLSTDPCLTNLKFLFETQAVYLIHFTIFKFYRSQNLILILLFPSQGTKMWTISKQISVMHNSIHNRWKLTSATFSLKLKKTLYIPCKLHRHRFVVDGYSSTLLMFRSTLFTFKTYNSWL